MEEEPNYFLNQFAIQIWRDLTEYLMSHPETLVDSYFQYWQSYMELIQASQKQSDITQHLNKQFQHADWQSNIIFNFIERSYLLFAKHIEQFSQNLIIEDEKIRKRVQFYSKQFIDSLSPCNFINTNPAVLEKIIKTNGQNIIDGFKRFQEDLRLGHGQLQIQQTDFSVYKLGNNIACTPGKVIYQNDLMQLIQYNPSTTRVHSIPLLMIPPWINKYYILDMQVANSFVKWLVDQGYIVFMISWVNPTKVHEQKEFSDYLQEGPLCALTLIQSVVGHNKINLLGYCIGGTLLACLLAYLAKNKSNSEIMSATFLTTLLDFSEPGELGIFIDEKQIALIENEMMQSGYLDGRILSAVFNALRAKDLIWMAFVQNYLIGEKPKPFDFLFWNADCTNVPAKVHQFYLRNMYLKNLLIRPNQITLNNVAIDLNQITTPSYFLAAHDDHIAPWQSCYQSYLCIPSEKQFVLTESGHVAGVINPPYKNKYVYWKNTTLVSDAAQFLESAQKYHGSWWLDWEEWLKKFSGESIPAEEINWQAYAAIEEAPGSYVKRKVFDL